MYILVFTLECASIIFYLTCQWWKTILLLILSMTYERERSLLFIREKISYASYNYNVVNTNW